MKELLLVYYISNSFFVATCRDVTAGATGVTAVAPKFSYTLNLFQPGLADSAPTSQRLHQKFPHGYISDLYKYLLHTVL